jgi:ABC-2 type transport system permease protein
MIRLIGAAIEIEWLKFRRSTVVVLTSLLLTFGVAAISAASLVAAGGSGAAAAKASAIVGDGGWIGLFAAATQVAVVASFLAFGTVTGWMFGREFTDGTVAGLFGQPVPRDAIATAKLIILAAWTLAVAILLPAFVIALGFALNLGTPPGELPKLAGRFVAVIILSGMLAVPSAVFATYSRGYLGAIGATAVIVVLAQIAVFTSVGGWFPFAAPGLWAASADALPSTIMAIQLLLVVPIALVAGGWTIRVWRGLHAG